MSRAWTFAEYPTLGLGEEASTDPRLRDGESASLSASRRVERRRWLKSCRFHVIFLWLPSPEHAVARGADRVRRGGHHVPPKIVRRRYHRGVRNFFRLYRPMANSWHVYDNSRGRKPRLIAIGHHETTADIFDSETWDQVAGKGDHG